MVRLLSVILLGIDELIISTYFQKECEFRSHKESYAPLMRSILHHRLPNHSETKFQSHVRVCCGKFSPDGELFISATERTALLL